MTWNINALKTKLEKPVVQTLLLQHNIIRGGSPHREGTVVMVKNYLARHVSSADYCLDDQVWLKFRCIPRILFGFCYIPPHDSEYFNHQSFAAIQEKISDGNCNYVIMCDLNCRFVA